MKSTIKLRFTIRHSTNLMRTTGKSNLFFTNRADISVVLVTTIIYEYFAKVLVD